MNVFYRLSLPIFLLSLTCPLACSSETPQDTAPSDAQAADGGADAMTEAASPEASTDASEDTTTDTTTDTDGSSDATDSAASSDAKDGSTSCKGACREVSLNAEFGGAPLPFDRAFYGLTPPENGGAWTIHLEAYAGGSSSCPTESSPTPDVTLVLGTMGLTSSAPAPSASLVDFDGNLLTGSPVQTATSVKVSALTPQVCVSCAQQQKEDPDGFVALDLDAVFPDGKVTGHIFATHCNSLDL